MTTSGKVKWRSRWRRLALYCLLGVLVIGCLSAVIIHRLLQPELARAKQNTDWENRSVTIQLFDEPLTWKQRFLSGKNHRHIKYMLLNAGELIDDDIRAIMRLEKIQGIALSGKGITQKHLEQLQQHPSLRVVLLSGTPLTQDDLRQGESKVEFHFVVSDLAQRMNELQIRYHGTQRFPLAANSQYPEITSELASLFGLPAVTIVDMRNVVVDRETIELLTSLDELVWLQVGYSFDDSFADLLPKFKHVTYLDLTQSMLTDDGVKAVLGMPSLRTIVLGPNMTDKTMEVLRTSQTIQEVYCHDSQVGDDGVVAVGGWESLQSINLCLRPITGTSLQALAKCPQLRNLHISGCDQLSEEDLDTVLAMKSLRKLSVDVSREKRELINRQLPYLELFP